jgi:CheY-like chemotaxis protein
MRADPDLRRIPVIVVSMVDDRKQCLALGAFEHMLKPIHTDRLMRTVGIALSRRLTVPSSPAAA